MGRVRKETNTESPAGAGRWLVIENLTLRPQVVISDNHRVEGKEDDLVIEPRGSVILRGSSPWSDDYNLEQAQLAGKLSVYRSDERPRKVPDMPRACDMGDPRYNNMLREIVFGRRENAEGFIKAEPRLIERANAPLDREWIKDVGYRLLNNAKAWLKAWGPPQSEQWRLELIENRLEEIRMIP